MDKIEKLQTLIDKAKNIVFFGGAGVSTESGIKDFRSKDGLYRQKFDYLPEVYLSRSFFNQHPDLFYQFYREKLNCLEAKPNICHNYLVKLENEGKLSAIITQNIDGLHEKAGSKKVLPIHGTIYKNHCLNCHKFYEAEAVFNSKGIPRCSCGGIIKPDVVLYEEALDEETLEKSVYAIANADLLIVGGTSLTVYPASGLINYFKDKNLVLINRDTTPFDNRADLVINESLGKVFGEI